MEFCGYYFLAFLPLAFGQLDKNKSTLSLVSHRPRTHVTHGTKLVYMLTILLDSGHSVDELDIDINGTFLQAHEHGLQISNFTWENELGNAIDDKELNPGVKIEMIGYENPLAKDTIKILVPATVGSNLIRSFNGTLEFTVSGGAKLASLLRPLMYVSLQSKQVVLQMTLVVGEYTFMEIPEIELLTPVPTEIDRKQKTKVDTRLKMPTGPMGQSLLKLYMPHNVTMTADDEDLYIEEPFLTVTNFKYLNSFGLSESSADAVSLLIPSFFSNSKTSEQDGVVVIIPEVSIDVATAHIDFESEAEMLDFAGAYQGTEMTMIHIFQTETGFFIIRNVSIIAKAGSDLERLASLSISLELLDAYRELSTLSTHFLIGLDHDTSSLGSAYNVSLMIYLPSFMRDVTLGKISDVVRSSKQIMSMWGESVLELNIRRLSFVNSVRIHANLSVDLEDEHFIEGHTYTLVVEAVYCNWRDMTDVSTIEGFRFKLGKDQDKTDDNCDEKGQREGLCDHCTLPWQCYNTIEGHGMNSTLIDYQGNRFFCSSATKNRNTWEFEPCVKVDSANRATVLDPSLGTLLGTRDADLFGIARDGQGYVTSEDGGGSWFGMEENIYTEVSLLDGFVASVLIPDAAN